MKKYDTRVICELAECNIPKKKHPRCKLCKIYLHPEGVGSFFSNPHGESVTLCELCASHKSTT